MRWAEWEFYFLRRKGIIYQERFQHKWRCIKVPLCGATIEQELTSDGASLVKNNVVWKIDPRGRARGKDGLEAKKSQRLFWMIRSKYEVGPTYGWWSGLTQELISIARSYHSITLSMFRMFDTLPRDNYFPTYNYDWSDWQNNFQHIHLAPYACMFVKWYASR